MEYSSVIKNKNTTWMDIEIIILREVSQKKTNTICYPLYMESKYEANKLIYETETGSQTCGCQGWSGRGMDWKFGVSGCE